MTDDRRQMTEDRTLNPKSETNPNDRNPNDQNICFENLNLFRASDFEFRASDL